MDSTNNKNIRVLVTGASGYIASHVVKLLLEGGYLVRGTVRSLKNETKVEPLKKLHSAAENLELVEADLLQPESWTKAVQDCTYVLHTASPFPLSDPVDPNEILKPAIEGTLAVLRAAYKAGSVKRVILTSSGNAIYGEGSDKALNEEHWTNVDDNINIYAKSKTLAEKAAWDFVKEHPSLELTVMNPGYVIGPLLHNIQCTSAEIFVRMLRFGMPMVPDLWYTLIDVRDVAEAHVKAMVTPEAAGQRFGLGNGLISFVEIAQILKEEFGPQGYWISAIPAPNWGVWFASFVDKQAKFALRELGRKQYIHNEKMLSILGITPIDFKKSIIDMGYSVIEKGFVKKTSKYKGQPAK